MSRLAIVTGASRGLGRAVAEQLRQQGWQVLGLSRQRVNEALRRLQSEGLIATEYGGLRLLDLQRLRQYRV